MKVVILNTNDCRGGAAIAANRLHRALILIGVDSKMLVLHKTCNDGSVIPLFPFKNHFVELFFAAMDRFPVFIYYRRTRAVFSPGWFTTRRIIKKINEINPDIVHLHWVNNGMLRMEELLCVNRPFVWSLHDMWPFTGGCHYDNGCAGYKKFCERCPVLGSKCRLDISRSLFVRKMRIYPQIQKLVINGLSRWIMKEAGLSVLFKGRQIVNIPNPIDTNQFRAIERKLAREKLDLDFNKKYLLFGAVRATGDSRKGFAELCDALHELRVQNLELLVFGVSAPAEILEGYPVRYLGRISDEQHLVLIYSAVDLLVVPSLQENLSNTIMESLACETPVVAFDIGGNGDIIDHKVNGFLAKPGDAADLAAGIKWLINNKKPGRLREEARKKVKMQFDAVKVAKQYLALYRRIVGKGHTYK